MRIISELFNEILNQKLELALTSDKESLLKNLSLGEKVTGTIVGRHGSLALIKIKGQVFKAQTNIALKTGSQVSLKVIDNNYPVRLKLLDELDSRSKLLANVQKDYLGIKASELKTNYSFKEIYEFFNSLKEDSTNENLLYKKLEIFKSILDYFNLEPKESDKLIITPKDIKEIFNIDIKKLHDLFEKLTSDLISPQHAKNLKNVENNKVFLDKNLPFKSKTDLINSDQIRLKNKTLDINYRFINNKSLKTGIDRHINQSKLDNNLNKNSLNNESDNKTIYTSKKNIYNQEINEINTNNSKNILKKYQSNLNNLITNYNNDKTKDQLTSNKTPSNNDKILNKLDNKEINNNIDNLNELEIENTINNKTVEPKTAKTSLDKIILKDKKDIIKEPLINKKEDNFANKNINKKDSISNQTETTNPKKTLFQKGETILKNSSNISDQAKKIYHPHGNKTDFIDNNQLIDKRLDTKPLVSQEVFQNVETISNHFKLLSNLVLQLNQTGIPFLLIPLWFNKSEGSGHLAYWKDDEEDNTSKAQRTQHLFFDLDLHRLGTIKIHVLIKGQKGLELFMWAKDSTLKLFRKESPVLKESLSNQGFNILGFEIWDIKHLEQKGLPITDEMPEITSGFHKVT